MREESFSNQARLVLFVNDMTGSLARIKESTQDIVDDIETRRDTMSAQEYFSIGWQLGGIDGYFRNLGPTLELFCTVLGQEELPNFALPPVSDPLEALQAFIEHLDQVESVFLRAAEDQLEDLEHSAEIPDEDISDWLTTISG